MAKQPEHFLAIDAGTTGITAIAFDGETFEPRARAYAEFPQAFPEPGWVEHDAVEMLSVVDSVVGQVVAEVGAPIAIGITNQRETVFALDRRTGEALGPGIVWQDRRTSARCQALREAGHAAEVGELTGLVLDPYFSSTKIEWMLKHRPRVAAAREAGSLVFLNVDGLLIHHLTRGERCVTDPTNASRTMLFDIDRQAWSQPLLDLFGVRESELPELVPSAGDFGMAHLPGIQEAIPIRGVLGDQQSALFGQGCWSRGSMKNTYGTGCFLLLNTGEERVRSSSGLLTTLAANGEGQPCYALEGSAFAGGAVIQWLRDQLGLLGTSAESESVASSVEDSGGVVLVPAFAGLGAPHWDADARAAILGMTRGTSRAHIVRAGLESIALQCADLVDALRADSGLAVEELLVDGGASANGLLMQLQADLARVAVVRPGDVEATARGAAMIAAVGVGRRPPRPEGEGAKRFAHSLDDGARRAARARWEDAIRRVKTGG